MNNDEKRVFWVTEYLDKLNLEDSIVKYYKDRNILVTGGAGAIGGNLVIVLSQLVGEKGEVVVLDNLSAIKTKEPWNVLPLQNVMFVRGDVRSDIDLKRVFKEEPSIIFHLAAFFANQNSIDYPETSAEVDVLGLIRLLEYARIAKLDKFIFGSSRCIYGSSPPLPIREDFISMHLTTPYQIAKMAGEMYCNYYNHHYDLKTVNCRFFNSYGPGETPGQYRNVIPNFIYWAMNGLSLQVTGEGEETRDFTFVLDLVQGLIKAGYYEEAVGRAFNLASGREISILHLAKLVNELTANSAEIRYKKRRKWDTELRILGSIQNAKELIRYNPFVEFEEGLRNNVEWFQDNWEMIKNNADFTSGINPSVR